MDASQPIQVTIQVTRGASPLPEQNNAEQCNSVPASWPPHTHVSACAAECPHVSVVCANAACAQPTDRRPSLAVRVSTTLYASSATAPAGSGHMTRRAFVA